MSKISQKSPEENNYERLKSEGDLAKRKEFEQKVKEGQLKWAFFAIDNDKYYHYYLKVNKKK